MCKCSEILDEMIKEANYINSTDASQWAFSSGRSEALMEAKSRIQALQYKVPTITIPEGTVLLGKDEYESLKEKAWRYDDLNK